MEKPKKDADSIPLYDGSSVYVSKVALARAYIPMPAIYTSRVTDLVIGKETLAKIARGEESPDKELLEAIISTFLIVVSVRYHDFYMGEPFLFLAAHVCKVFAIRGDQLTESVVKEFINHKLSTLKGHNLKSQ